MSKIVDGSQTLSSSVMFLGTESWVIAYTFAGSISIPSLRTFQFDKPLFIDEIDILAYWSQPNFMNSNDNML